MRGLAYGFLLLSGLSVAGMAPLTRFTETASSRYTYHVVRSFVAMLLGMSVMATSVEGGLRRLLGTAETRPWFVTLGAAQWLFLWGYVKAVEKMDGAPWATIHYCTYPIFATLVAFLASAEPPRWGFFAYTIGRNFVVIVLIMAEDLLSNVNGHVLQAAGFCVVTAASHGCVTAIFRRFRGLSPFIPMFWSDAMNTVLWIPPGLLGVRVTFLWPEEAQDTQLEHHLDIPPLVWLCLCATGVLAVGGVVSTGYALRHLDAACVAAFAAPLAIAFSVAADAALGQPPPPCAIAGILIFCACTAVELSLQALPEDAPTDEDSRGESGQELLPSSPVKEAA